MDRNYQKIDALNQVAEFHKTFQQPIVEAEAMIPNQARCDLRVSLIAEELKEFDQAIKDKDIIEVADALCDLQYVLCGAVLEFGLAPYFPALMTEVHRSNMSKVCHSKIEAEDTKLNYAKQDVVVYIEETNNNKFLVKRKEDEKVLKSINYSSPRLLKTIQLVDTYEPHQRRVLEEESELNVKVRALRKFTVTPFFNTLPVEDKNLLINQLDVMEKYLNILQERIKRF